MSRRRTVRLYGFTRGWGSYRQVTNGFWTGLQANGWAAGEDLALQPLDGLGLEDEDEPQVPLATADEAILTGPPSMWPMMHQGARHAERSVMVAPNSDALPTKLMRELSKAATRLLAPSKWAMGIVQLHTELPVLRLKHGIADGFTDARRRDFEELLFEMYRRDEFTVLHLTSTVAERKSTVLLLRAWHELMYGIRYRGALPASSMLHIVVPDELKAHLFSTGLVDDKSVRIFGRIDGWGGSPATMSSVYSNVHVLCQPSRGEAFGMTPLEARACGLPVVATACTGHEEHMPYDIDAVKKGIVHVPHGPNAAIDDLPGARAPSVTVDAIAGALRYAYDNWRDLHDAAMERAESVRLEWSWRQQLEGF